MSSFSLPTLRPTKKPVGGQTKGTQTAMFQKTMMISLAGSSPEEIQEVASAIHGISHPLTTGTRHKRRVTVSALSSSKVLKIFDGKVSE